MKYFLLIVVITILGGMPVHAKIADPDNSTPAPVGGKPSIEDSLAAASDLVAKEQFAEAAELLADIFEKGVVGDDKKRAKALIATVAQHFSALGKKSSETRDYQKAVTCYQIAIELHRLGGNISDCIVDLFNLAGNQEKLHAYPDALKSYTLLVKIVETLDRDSILVAEFLEARAKVYDRMGQDDEVLKDTLRALAIYEKIEGKEKNYQNCVKALASAYLSLYRYDDAKRELSTLLALQKQAGPEAEPRVASTLFRLAELTRKSYQFTESEALYLQSLKIVKRLFATKPEKTTFILQGLGRLYQNSGRFAEAEQVFNDLIAIYERIDETGNEYVKGLVTKADFLSYIGRYNESIQLYQKAINLRERLFNPKSLEVLDTKKDLANVLTTSGKYLAAEKLYSEILIPMADLVGEKSIQIADVLDDLARLYKAWGRFNKAEDTAQNALEIMVSLYGPDSSKTMVFRSRLADILVEQARFIEAEDGYRKNLAIAEQTFGKQHKKYAWALRDLGRLLRSTSDYDEAEAAFLQALSIDEAIYGVDSVRAVNNRYYLATVHSAKGSSFLAEEMFQKVLQVKEAVYGKMSTKYIDSLKHLAFLHMDMGKFTKAHQELLRVISIEESFYGKDHYYTSGAKENLAVFHRRTGNYARAEELYRESLSISKEYFGESSPNVASTLHNLGWLYYCMNNYSKSIETLIKAKNIYEAFYGGHHQKFANTLAALAQNYSKTGRFEDAEKLFKTSLALNSAQKLDDAWAEWGLGSLYVEQERYTEALPHLKEALRVAQNQDDSELIWKAQAALCLFMERTGKIEAAIFFGKQAVNSIQGVRNNVAGLDKKVQSSYQETVTHIYKRLADMLIQQGRLPEAQQVMNLLKQQEYFQYVRRDAGESSNLSGSTYTAREDRLDSVFQKTTVSLSRVIADLNKLRRKRNRTPAEEEKLTLLKKAHAEAVDAYNGAFDAIAQELGQMRKDKVNELKEAESLMSVLRELKQGAVAIYTLVGEDKFRSILITPRMRKAFEYSITDKELYRLIADFRTAVTDRHADSRPLAEQLYHIIIEPMADDLRGAKAQTLMWSLDGALRYLPVAALYDGRHYLVEQYRNVVFTAASQANLKDVPSSEWKGLALGVSKPHPGFASLPFVPEELHSIIRTDASATGALQGELLLDENFTWEAAEDHLRQEETYPLVHIASHFQFTSGNEMKSFLLLGDGQEFTISELKEQEGIFYGVELLTLSACNTAVGDLYSGDGKEVEGFAVLAQRKGAKAVMATLWPVADDSTAQLMGNFYRLREEQRLSKVEALRQAQLLLLNGQLSPSASGEQERARLLLAKRDSSAANKFQTDPAKPFAHPYYWAPFILMGNWK